jgi:hypothetical protein
MTPPSARAAWRCAATAAALGVLALAAFVLAITVTGAPALAQTAAPGPSAAEVFADADLALGERLITEHKCSDCHVRRFGGDGTSIYRPAGRINTPGFLRGMVEQCNTELNLGLFPEEVSAVAAVLNRRHYRFK